MCRDRRLIARVGIAVVLTSVLMTAFFSYMHFELYGEGGLCRQKYDLPPFSFYTERFDCFVFIGDLAADVGQISVLVSGPLLLSGIATVCVVRQRRWAGLRRGRSRGDAEAEPVGAANQVQLLFWILTVSLGLPLAVCLALWAVGLSVPSPARVIGVVLFYGIHLYPAGLLAFAVVQVASWLWRTAMVAVRRPR